MDAADRFRQLLLGSPQDTCVEAKLRFIGEGDTKDEALRDANKTMNLTANDYNLKEVSILSTAFALNEKERWLCYISTIIRGGKNIEWLCF